MNVLSKLRAKGRIAAVLALGFTTLFSGCKEEDPPAVSVDRPIIRTSMAEKTENLRVISNTYWEASIQWEGGETDWISMPRTTGRGTMDLTLYIEKCITPLMDGRQATITFTTTTSPAAIATVKVRQGHDEGVLELRPDQVEVGAAAGTVKFLIVSNTQWEIVGLSDWATATPIQGEGDQVITVNFNAYANHGYDREAKFVVSTTRLGENNFSADFVLTQRDQEDPTLILGQETIYFEAAGGSMSVPVITNTSEDPIVSSMTSWCTAVYNNGSINVTVTPNETTNQRECIITVIAKVDNATVTKQIMVIQAGMQDPKIFVTNANVTLPAVNPSDPTANIALSVGYYTEPAALVSDVELIPDSFSWLTATLGAGNTVSISAQPNPGKDMRQATLTLKLVSAGKTITAAITVIQNGAGELNLMASPAVLNAVQAGETLEFAVISDLSGVEVEVLSSKAWAVATATEATTADFGTVYTVSVVVAANSVADSRDAVLTVTGTKGDQSQTLTVNLNQAGTGSPQASLVRNSITVPKVGDDYQVGIFDTEGITGWTYSASANWISGIAFNSTDGTIDFTVADNTVSAANRTAVISIIATKGGKSQQLDLEVIQLGTGAAELVISEQDITLPAAASTYTVFIEELNGTTWTVLGFNPQDMFANPPAANVAETGLDISITANTTTSPRNATINLIATNGDSTVPYTITISQEGLAAPDVVPVTNTVYVGREATATDAETVVQLLNVDSSINLTFSATANSAMFAAATAIEDGNLKIAVTANDGTEQRTGELTVVATRGGQNQLIKITVIQAGTGTPDLTIGSTAFMFGPDAQTAVSLFFVNENGALVTVASKPSWITENTALADGVWVFDVEANGTNIDRSGEIVLKAVLGGKTVFYNVPVLQYGLESLGASLTVSSIQVDYDAADPTTDIINLLNVPDGATVNVYSSQTWLTLDGTNTSIAPMTAPYEITPSVTANPRPYERTGTIAFEITRGTESQVLIVSVMQHALPAPDALTLTVVPGALNFEATDTAARILTIVGYDSALTYVIGTSDAWLTVSAPDSNGAITVTPTANTGAARTATIYISVGGITQEIPVTQAGVNDVTLILDHASVDFNAADAGATAAVAVNVVNPGAGLTYSVNLGGSNWFTATVSGSVITVTPTAANDGPAKSGTIVVNALSGSTIVASKVISVTQSAYGAPVLSLTLGQASADFAAAEDNTVSIGFTAYATTGAVYAVEASATWIDVDIDPATGVGTISPIAANTGAFRSGTVTVIATLDGQVATKTIPVTQAGATPVVITPTSYQVNFPASATAGTLRTITLIGYDSAIHNFTASPNPGSWYTVHEPNSPMDIEVNGPWTGAAERKATVQITITNQSDGSLVSTFPITIVQDGAIVPNITYAPDVFYNVPVEGTAGSGTNVPLKTIFVNPEGVQLNVINTTLSSSFISAAVFNGDFLEITVAQNTNYSTRTGQVVVSATDDSSVVKTYTITIHQDGTGAVAPAVYAQFNDGGTVYLESNPQTTSPYSVGMTLAPGVTITGASVTTVSGTSAWLTGATPTATGFDFAFDPSVFAETSTVEGVVQVNLSYFNGTTTTPFSVYYYVRYRGELPEIGATWLNNVANIEAIDTEATVTVDDSTLTPPLALADLSAVFTVTGVTYTGTASGWLASAAGTWDPVTGVFTLSGIAANTTGDARSAVVKITLSATGYKDQVMEFVVNQAGLLTYDTVYPAAVTLTYNQTLENIDPILNADGAEILGAIAITGTMSTWVDNCTCAVGSDQLNLTCGQNSSSEPRVATLTFTVGGVAGYKDKVCVIDVIQMPQTTNTLLEINPITPLAWGQNSQRVVTYVDKGLALYTTPTSVTLSVVSSSYASVTPATGLMTQATVTATSRNTTNAPRDCKFVLRAENNGIVEFYEIIVPQLSLTAQDIYNATSLSGGNGIRNLQYTTGNSTVIINAIRDYTIFWIPANCQLDITNSISGWSISASDVSVPTDDNDVIRNGSEGIGDTSSSRVVWQTHDRSGTATLKFIIKVDNVSAVFTATINVS